MFQSAPITGAALGRALESRYEHEQNAGIIAHPLIH